MAKQISRTGEPPIVDYVVGGPLPKSFATKLTPEQLKAGSNSLATAMRLGCTNTIMKEEIIAAADWLRGAYAGQQSYLVADLCRELDINSSATINKYAAMAGLRTPRRGQRDFRYTAIERRQIYQHIAESSSDSKVVARCRELLENRK